MRALWTVPAVVAAALALLAALLLGVGDRSVFTSPPDAVAEQFMRKLATGRYELARDHLSEELRRRTPAAELERAARALEQRHGRIRDVRGEPGPVHGQAGEAKAVLSVAGEREVALHFRLEARHGAWALSSLGELAAPGRAAAR